MKTSDKQKTSTEAQLTPSYEPPRVEAMLTAEELEREVIFAGANGSQIG